MIKNKINVLFVCISIIYFVFAIFISEKLSFLIVDNKVFDSYNPESFFLNEKVNHAEFELLIKTDNLVNIHLPFFCDSKGNDFKISIIDDNKKITCGYKILADKNETNYLEICIYPSLVNKRNKNVVLKIESSEYVNFLYCDKELKQLSYKQYGYCSKKNQIILSIFFFICCIILFCFLALLIFKEIKPYNLYLLLAIIFGFINVFVKAPLSQPDAITHYESIYSFSNRLLGLKANDGYILKRNCDLYFLKDYYAEDFSVNKAGWNGDVKLFFMSIADNFNNLSNKTLVEVPKYKIIVSPRLEYIPQAVLMSVGRLLGFNQFLLYFFVLLGNYALMVLLIYKAIKIVGDNYLCFFYLGLNPLILQIIQSVSYDAIVYSLSLLVIAYVYKFFVESNVTKKDYISSSVCSLLLFPMKGVYFPISLLIPIAIVLKNIKRVVLSKKIIISVLAFFILFIIFMIIKFDSKVSDYYSIVYMFHHPIQTFIIFSRTLFLGTDWYSFSDALLMKKYNFNIVLLIFILLFRVENRLTNKQIFILIFTYISISILLFIVAFTWTQCGSREIWGLQERYFYPILPLLMLSVQKFSQDKVLLDKKYGLLIISLCYFAWLLMSIRF